MLQKLQRTVMQVVVCLAIMAHTEASAQDRHTIIKPSEARAHAGQRVTVEGLVADVGFSKGGGVYLNFDRPYPMQTFAGAVPKSAISDIGVDNLKRMKGTRIRITGEVSIFKGRPQISIFERSQLEPVPSPSKLDDLLSETWGSNWWLWVMLAAFWAIFLPIHLKLKRAAVLAEQREREEQQVRWQEIERVKKEEARRQEAQEMERRKREDAHRREVEEEERRRLTMLQAQRFLEDVWPPMASAICAWDALLTAPTYFSNFDYSKWVSEHSTLQPPPRDVCHALPPECHATIETFTAAIRDGRAIIDERNKSYVENEIGSWSEFFDILEKNPLTEAQRIAAVTEEDNTLVLAGAGTGKTSTIMAKVAYLLERRLALPLRDTAAGLHQEGRRRNGAKEFLTPRNHDLSQDLPRSRPDHPFRDRGCPPIPL